MKSGLLLVLVSLLAPGCLGAAAPNLELTIDGITYSNFTWGTVTPTTVTLFHQAGVSTVALNSLPEDLQERFHYDPTKVPGYVPPPEPPVKTLSRNETSAALAKAIREVPWDLFETEARWYDVGKIRSRYKALLELQKTGHPDYRSAIRQFSEACKRGIDRYYQLQKKPDATTELTQLLDEANLHWTEGQHLKTLADAKGRPANPKPDPYLHELP